MRTLSSTLLAAQRGAARAPYLRVEVRDRAGDVSRLAWSRLYTGSEADYHHAVTMPGDGSLIRARIEPANSNVYVQRVASPGPSSDFSQWATGPFPVASSISGTALASYGAQVLLFYVDIDQITIYCAQSSNYGSTFGAPVTVITAPGAVSWLAAAYEGTGDYVALFFSVGSAVYVIKRSGSSWGSPVAWSNSASAVTGLACFYAGDWNLVAAGQDSASNHKVWSCVYGDGYSASPGAWSALAELAVASAGSSGELRCPSAAYPDVYRLFYVEKYTGSGAYSRPYWSHSVGAADFINGLWREPVPFNLVSTYGLSLASSGAYAWLSCPFGVWRAALVPPAVEVGADLLEAALSVEPEGGRLDLTLRNDDGRYGGIGAGAYAAIKEGSQVRLGLGYRTSAGNEYVFGPYCWIEGWEHRSAGGQATFHLQARSAWGLLESWRARRQFRWAAGSRNLYQLLAFILARAGLELSSFSASPALTSLYPAFTISPEESGAIAVRRLLALAPDVLLQREGSFYVKYPQASDVSSYAYGTNHPFWEGRYRAATRLNWAQAYGSGVLGEAFAWPDLERAQDRLSQAHDLNLTTLAQAQDRASAELRRSLGVGGELAAPVNCGQELYDVVGITDSRAGLSGALRRVAGWELAYAAGKRPRYEQRLKLGGV